MDMIFGDIRKFITDDILDSFDKVLKHGHFTLIRNTRAANAFYKMEVPGKHNYKEVFSSPKNYAFDEWGRCFLIFGAMRCKTVLCNDIRRCKFLL